MFKKFNKKSNFSMKDILQGIQSAVFIADESLKKDNLKIFNELFIIGKKR